MTLTEQGCIDIWIDENVSCQFFIDENQAKKLLEVYNYEWN